jgi:hypothetical protein
MVYDREAWHAASVLVEHYGDNAHELARTRWKELEDAVDPVGLETWRRITAAIEELQRVKRRKGEGLH